LAEAIAKRRPLGDEAIAAAMGKLLSQARRKATLRSCKQSKAAQNA
jgi:hypothetical protein